VKRLWLADLAGSALLLFLVDVWLGIPDRKTWQLAATAVLGLAIVGAALWLVAATFAAFDPEESALRRLPRVAACAAAAVAVCLALAWLAGYFPKWSAWLGSALTLKLHRPVDPRAIHGLFELVRRLLAWMVVPALAIAGVRGWRVRRRFWLEYLAVWLLAWYLPWRLVHWVPLIENLAGQMASFVLRFGVAWVLAVSGWLVVVRASRK
jgi:hypothetical protein